MNKISDAFSTNLRERIKALWLGVQGAVAGYVVNIASQPNFNPIEALINWKPIVGGALLAGGLYILNTFISGKKA